MIENDTSSRGHGGRKSRRIDLFVAQLICHATVAEATAAAKISTASGWRYLRDPSVLARVREAGRETMEQSKALLLTASVEAVEALRETLRSTENEGWKISAARVLLEIGLKTLELANLEERINALEQIAKSGWKGLANDREAQAPDKKAGGVNGSA